MKAWKGFLKEYCMYWVASRLAGAADRVPKIKMMSLILFGEAAAMPDWEALPQKYKMKEGVYHNGTQPKRI